MNFEVATILSWVIEEWNEADFRFLDLPAQKLGFYIFENKSIVLLLKLFSQITRFVSDPHQGKAAAFFAPII